MAPVKRIHDRLRWAVPLLAALCSAMTLAADRLAGDEAPIVGKDPVPKLVVAPARSQLDELLARKIEYLDGVCGLSDDQKKKLELAGRGDINHLLGRIEDLRTKSQPGQINSRVEDLLLENESLKRLLITGPFERPSLFGKTQRQLLTEEQLAKLEADGIIFSSAWTADFGEARELSRKHNRPMVVHFHADWAAPCCQMKEILYRPAVVRFMHDHFIPVFIDTDRDDSRQLMRQYGINSIPSDLLLAPDGAVVGRSLGTKTEQGVMEMLQSLAGPARQPPQQAGAASSPESTANPR